MRWLEQHRPVGNRRGQGVAKVSSLSFPLALFPWLPFPVVLSFPPPPPSDFTDLSLPWQAGAVAATVAECPRWSSLRRRRRRRRRLKRRRVLTQLLTHARLSAPRQRRHRHRRRRQTRRRTTAGWSAADNGSGRWPGCSSRPLRSPAAGPAGILKTPGSGWGTSLRPCTAYPSPCAAFPRRFTAFSLTVHCRVTVLPSAVHCL